MTPVMGKLPTFTLVRDNALKRDVSALASSLRWTAPERGRLADMSERVE